jgi:PAS domain S-box-containing protein
VLNLDADNAGPLDVPSAEATLAQRLRVACWAALCAIVLYALLDTTVGHPRGWTLRALDAALAASLVGILIARRYASTARALRRLALAGTAAICATAAAFGIIARDPIGPPVLLCVLALSAAIVFPWGFRTQLWAVAMAALAITAQFVWSSGAIRALPFSAVLATIIGLAASALIAWELERHRRGIAQRDQILRQHARHQRAWIAALPVTLHRTILQGAQSGRMIVSDNVERLVGYASAHFVATDGIARWSQCVHPDDRAVFRVAFAELLTSGRATSEYRMQHSDGSYRWLLTHAVLLRDERGEPSEVIGSMLDLTERKRVEEELACSELRHRLVTQATTDLIWDWDLRSDVVTRNDALQSRFGHAPETIAANATWSLDQIHEQDRARVQASIRAVLDGEGCDWRAEYRFRRGNGEYAFVADRGYVGRPRRRGLRLARGVPLSPRQRRVRIRRRSRLRHARRARTAGPHGGRNERRNHAQTRRRAIAAQRGAFPLAHRAGVRSDHHRRRQGDHPLRKPVAFHRARLPARSTGRPRRGRFRLH